ncbi:Nicotinate dehydrogenase subunit B [Roseibaca ekhonensis]|uniref:Nicotinate dehydrogenase subunit B n=1 Tax=Roseinatronobacter ekhonensis TaxID=254356 RepID=A0A3B0MVS2_9RHOB|nr:cytochrome c [Roseibaca ekhonensis]SUZ33839.1 Nicotinate dehydrogenase subunit B [Roseibaca ekhonensis]
MKRAAFVVLALGLLGGAAAWFITRPSPLPATVSQRLTGDAAAGERIFLAGGCASCHMGTQDGADPKVLRGGAAFDTQFGTFYAPNISPDPDHGIGGWSQADFLNAVMRGISPQGQHYYPAFPYTSYAKADPQDVADLYAYMMTLPADATPSRAHDLGFPFNIRRSVGVWKALYMNRDWVVTGDLTAEETQGRYLAEALAHCAECHTPRDMLGGMQTANWLQGAANPSGDGRIPPIAGEDFTWTAFDISAYLETGFTPSFDVAGGSMAKVIANLGQLDKAELDAIAAYILRADKQE